MTGSLLLLIAGSAAVAGVARRLGLPAPLLLVPVGLAASFVPGASGAYRLDPELVLPFVLPPLLYKEAVDSSYLRLRAMVRPIAMLSFGYVLFAAFTVGLAVHFLVPGVPLTAALVLGAVVAPTDAVAATAIARRVGLPPRAVTVLQGEGLVNDATAITTFRVAVAAAAGTGVTALGGVVEFLVAAVGGVVVGLVLGVPLQWLRSRLEDPRLRTTVSLLVPFVAYAGAERIEASGVLAVVVTGLYMGHRSATVDFATRITEGSVWKMIAFVLESAVFALIGLQFPVVLRGLGGYSGGELTGYALLVLAVLIAGRFAWTYPASYLPRLLSRRIREREPNPGWKQIFVISWAGMRGVVSLAVAFSIPLVTADHRPFPARNLILFLAFVAVFGSLVLLGYPLPRIIGRLNLPAPDRQRWTLAEAQAQEIASNAAEERLDALLGEPSNALPGPLEERLRTVLARRRNSVWERLGAVNPETGESADTTYRRLAAEMIETERSEFLRLRDEGRIGDELMRRLQRRLDFEEAAGAVRE